MEERQGKHVFSIKREGSRCELEHILLTAVYSSSRAGFHWSGYSGMLLHNNGQVTQQHAEISIGTVSASSIIHPLCTAAQSIFTPELEARKGMPKNTAPPAPP